MKIVIDTNTLINASGDDYNYGNRIIDEILNDKIQVFANRETLKENRLLINKKITDQQFLYKLEQYFYKVEQVDSEYINVVEDREDNKILASAVKSGSEYLITSDWHLLKLKEYEGVKILSPQGFWAEYESETGKGWHDWLNNFIK
ncbi:MAG: putative toxin-antitoxin system toxin component, PIN family [Candidatus Doudnabacteria bacterium]|nr:putative toxin-antitoxin system toxin component, PIN family [Candidatus Doudnabacteria bacterium]